MSIRKSALLVFLMAISFPSFAINKAGMSGFRYSVSESGRVASIRPNQSGSTGSLGSVGSIPSGHVGSQIGNTGWYVGASGSGNPSGGATMNMGHAGDVFFAGTKYPFQAGYQVPKSAVVDALGMLCKNPLICLGIAAASPAIKGWLDEGNVGINPDASDYPDKPFLLKKDGSCSSDCREYLMPDGNTWVRSLSQACNAHLQASRDSGGAYYQSVSVISQTQCSYEYAFTPSPSSWTKAKIEPQNRKTTATWTDWMPASMDDIAPYMDAPDVPAQVVSDILDKGGDIALPSAPTVAGPSQVQGPRQETTNADGTKDVTQVTNNYKTDGNTITNTSTTTINQKCTAAGACTDVSSNTTTNPDEPQKPEDPASDTPLVPLPKLYERKYPEGMTGIWQKKRDQLKQTSLVSFVNQMMPTGFVSGTCPSWQLDLSIAQWADMGVHEVAPPCWIWPAAKAILIVSALILARALIFGG